MRKNIHKWTEEEKRIKSENMKGKHNSPNTEFKKGQVSWNKGKHLSEEHRAKLSVAKKGSNHLCYGKHRSEETKKKIGEWHKGKIVSTETRMKQRLAKLGKIPSNKGTHLDDETKSKMSELAKERLKNPENHPMYGKHHTEETKKKIGNANKGKLKGAKNPNWHGGIYSKIFEEAFGMNWTEWQKLSQEIRNRDNFICQYCGASSATIVHHIIPRYIKIDNSNDNLITLCQKCHRKVESLTNKKIKENKNPIEIFYEKWSN